MNKNILISPMILLKKPSLLCLPLMFLVCFILSSFNRDISILESLLKKLKQYDAEQLQQKMYLHLDKPFYAAGENVWFKAYLMQASLHSLDSQSNVIYIEIINAARIVVIRRMIYAYGGISFGDFQLPDTLSEGNYAIRAYTNYMKNVGEDFFFYKEFPVLNSVKERAEFNDTFIDSIDLEFFPEGGNFVACGFNRIAFKALKPDGSGINVEGIIVDNKNTVITTFKSQHNGMGLVQIKPTPDEKYFARITKPDMIDRTYALPLVREEGYIMQVHDISNAIKVLVFKDSYDNKSDDKTISIIVQSNAKAYHAVQGEMKNNAFYTIIPKSKFPDGISQITVFDSKGRAVAERLIHQNKHENINLVLQTDTAFYKKRELVSVLLDASFKDNDPATGNFSISVYDEGLIKDSEKYPLSIVNYLTLTSNLRGYIENPGYYFKDSLPETKRNLDLLMMVNGWRRFTWDAVLQYQSHKPHYKHELGIPLSGRILKAAGKNPPDGSILKILAMDGSVVRLKPDSSGSFYTDSLMYYDSMNLVFQTENIKKKKQPYKFVLDTPEPSPASTYRMSSFYKFDASNYLKQQAEEKLIESSSKIKILDELKVEAKRETRDPRLLGDGGKGRTLNLKDLSGESYSNVFQLIQGRLPGIEVSSSPSGYGAKMRGREVTVFLVDGYVTDINLFAMYAPADVDYIEILPNSTLHGGSAINIISKRGGSAQREAVGVNQVKYPGFYSPREFYSPRYDVKDDRHALEDKRTTLFWEPMIITDQNGHAAVTFYTSDVASRYRVVVEGVTPDGYPGAAVTYFEVE